MDAPTFGLFGEFMNVTGGHEQGRQRLTTGPEPFDPSVNSGSNPEQFLRIPKGRRRIRLIPLRGIRSGCREGQLPDKLSRGKQTPTRSVRDSTESVEVNKPRVAG